MKRVGEHGFSDLKTLASRGLARHADYSTPSCFSCYVENSLPDLDDDYRTIVLGDIADLMKVSILMALIAFCVVLIEFFVRRPIVRISEQMMLFEHSKKRSNVRQKRPTGRKFRKAKKLVWTQVHAKCRPLNIIRIQ